MKVVFVASGNKKVGTVSSFVRAQFDSLQREGLEMLLFPIVGHGWKPYLCSIRSLRNTIRREKPDIVHAHYSVCGVVAAAAAAGTNCKVVVSILGSFPKKNFKKHWCKFFIKHFWNATLVKSQRTARQLGINLPVIPSGVNIDQFTPIDYQKARELCGFEEGKKYVIWCSNPERSEKNYPLARAAVEELRRQDVSLVPVFDKPHSAVAEYMCAADALLLTSKMEGSPNVVKEAMACNCPIATTDVGDVRENLDGLPGAYISRIDSPIQVAEALASALAFGQRTAGRQQLVNKGLTTEAVAKRMVCLYSETLSKQH